MFHLKSKKAKVLLGLIIAAGVLSGCGAVSGDQMVISSFGNQSQWRVKDIFNPFHKKTGIKIKPAFSNGPASYAKLEKSPNNGTDVDELAEMNSVEGAKKGIFRKLNPNKMSNYKYLTPGAKKAAKQADGVPISVSSTGIIYNKKKLGKITSWKQLWSKRLRGKVMIPQIDFSNGPAMLNIAGEVAGTPVQKDGGKAAFRQLRKLKPNLIKNMNGNDAVKFKRGDLLADVSSEFTAPEILRADKDLAYVVPKGSFSSYAMASVPKGSKHLNKDYKYINYRISKNVEARDGNFKTLNESPVNSKTRLHGKSARDKTYGKNVKHSTPLDYKFAKAHLSEWINEWNHIMR